MCDTNNSSVCVRERERGGGGGVDGERGREAGEGLLLCENVN